MGPHPSFRQAFTQQVKNQIVELLLEVSEAAVENFDAASDLSTNMTFGVDLYQFANQAFLRAAQRPGSNFEAHFVGNAFRCRAGRWDFGIYRVGRRPTDDIRNCFPNSGNTAGEIGCPYLPGMDPEIHNVRGAIVAYMCDPADGLGAVYLCIPSVDSEGRITDWAYTEQLWRREDDPTAEARPLEDTSAAPERVDQVTVRRRVRGSRRAG